MERYQRQILLPEVGIEGQRLLQNSRVLIVGAGGLGTPAAQYLAAAGVGHLTIVDGDTVHASNLHRQVLFRSEDLGKNKAEILAQRLREQNPDVRVEAIPFYLNKSFALAHFNESSVIVDGTDNFETKFLINDVACVFDKPVVFAAISQFEGQLSVFWKSEGPCYRCLLPEPPKAKIRNCIDGGVLGPVPGILGTMQAMEAIKVLLWRAKPGGLQPLIGKLQIFNFFTNEQRTLRLRRRLQCRCETKDLSPHSIVELSLGVGAPCDAPIVVEQIIDVRTAEEWNEFHLKGSLHWPLSLFEEQQLPPVSHKKKYALICQSGVRATRAQEILQKYGYSNFEVISKSVYDVEKQRSRHEKQ